MVSVGYRRAPEHPFPTAFDDCYAVTRWVAAHGSTYGIDTRRVSVGGSSRGRQPCRCVTQLARSRGDPQLAFQLLVYPPTQYGAKTESMRIAAAPSRFGPAAPGAALGTQR